MMDFFRFNTISPWMGMLLGVMLLGGCGETKKKQDRPGQPTYQELKSSEQPLVQIVYRPNDESSVVLARQYREALDYTKIPYNLVNLDEQAGSFEIDGRVRVLCLTTHHTDIMTDAMVEKLVEFASGGNTIIFGQPVLEDRFAFLQGIKPASEYPINENAKGFRFKTNVLPGMKDRKLHNRGVPYHGGLRGDEFTEDMDILATAGNTYDYPVMLKRRLGAGEVYVYNTYTFNDKFVRGLLFANVAEALEGVPYEVANVSTIFIDDFPAPLYNEKMQPIDKEYDITHAQFVVEKFWPDMKALADTFDITYSAMTAFNYNANIVPPFDFLEWEHGRAVIDGKRVRGSVALAQDIARSRHELAFHGYNHFSLWQEDWPNKQFMINSLEAAKKRWYVDNLGELPVTYVPPTNHIDSVGLQAITEGMPSIKYMCSLYLGDVEEGGGREFGPDPLAPSLFDYPRVTSGFYDSASELFDQQNLYMLTGVWNHFIHPDDVFQLPGEKSDKDHFLARNRLGLGWHSSRLGYGLYEEFRRRIVKTRNLFPLIRFEAARDGAPEVQRWLNNRVTYNTDGNRLVMHRFKSESELRRDTTLSYWFAFVPSAERPRYEQWAKSNTENMAFTPFYDGYLMQFAARTDSLALPSLDPDLLYDPSYLAAQSANTLQQYRVYQTEQNPMYARRIGQRWQDTRLEDALSAYRKRPDDPQIQERLIEMSVEFDSLQYALEVLEQRMMGGGPPWPRSDRSQLIKFYGWESAAQRGWAFADSLWQRYPAAATLEFNRQLVQSLGFPGPDYQRKWMDRRLEVYPNDPEVLSQYISRYQSEEHWPEIKPLLRRMLRQNPESDTLYAYSIQRSFWYDHPSQTLQWLKEFPVDAESQLAPFAGQIAQLYAYTGNNKTRALEWARKTDQISRREQMQWLLDLQRYDAFRERAISELENEPRNDSLRYFVANNLFDAGYYEQAYRTAYPIYERSERPPERLHRKIQQELFYSNYDRRQRLYNQYPAIFSDTLANTVQTQYRRNEGVKVSASGSYESDNFDNTVWRAGTGVEWGNRRKQTHRVEAEQLFVGSDLLNQNLSDNLQRLSYTYTREFNEQRLQTAIGGGLLYAGSTPYPEGNVQASYATESTFTSGRLRFGPVLTNTALEQRYHMLHGSAYREDPLVGDKLRSSLSLEGRWYTNDVWQGGATGRLFTDINPLRGLHLRPTIEGSYMDATRKYQGTPYWTPDQLAIGGAGLNVQYRRPEVDPLLQLEGEVMPKYDNRDGAYLTARTGLNTRLGDHWDLGVEASWSSSDVYRSNRYFLTLSYYLPKERDLNPPSNGLPTQSAGTVSDDEWRYSYEEALRDYRSYERARQTPGLFTARLDKTDLTSSPASRLMVRIKGEDSSTDTLLSVDASGRYRLNLMPGQYTAQPVYSTSSGNTTPAGDIHAFQIYPMEHGDLVQKTLQVNKANTMSGSRFRLQFGAFKSRSSARRKAADIRSRLPDIRIDVAQKASGLFAVRTSSFSSRNEAEALLDEIQRRNGPLAFLDIIKSERMNPQPDQPTWRVQLGAFSKLRHAVRLAQTVKLRYGLQTRLMQISGDTLYRVMAGGEHSRDHLQAMLRRIKRLPGLADAYPRHIDHPRQWSSVVLETGPARFTISGTVQGKLQVEDDGRLIALGGTPALIEQLDGTYRRSFHTEPDGSFELHNLPTGTYTVRPLNHNASANGIASSGTQSNDNDTNTLHLVWKAKKEDELEMRALQWAGPDMDEMLRPDRKQARYSVQLGAFKSHARARAYATAMAHQLHRKTLIYKDLDTNLFNVSLERTMDRLQAYQWKDRLKRQEGLGDVFVTAV